ncbi:hypothetical protein BU24DRAFT_140503 [Aaosphaeria arxii CBS 175.79]|uniref:Zn(2)-C6 fungal-type domain-containing protein n=1 Tax=Aaosphaeria arxii CBS 175.79 TaxID=1450172 RepID=A0A6A5XVE3_9PLEO|nr:uncharacterized protein BU24DRAFT_140503 [Aaosphaeria arxii CBS 175.79]KAF2016906.1 hypothetical protein BU24DRAFT_140503 [Aaosphaeria arxii CBS 175.79]
MSSNILNPPPLWAFPPHPDDQDTQAPLPQHHHSGSPEADPNRPSIFGGGTSLLGQGSPQPNTSLTLPPQDDNTTRPIPAHLRFAAGLSDEEDGAASSAALRSFANVRKASKTLHSKISPKRASSEEHDDRSAKREKRLRDSLFGGDDLFGDVQEAVPNATGRKKKSGPFEMSSDEEDENVDADDEADDEYQDTSVRPTAPQPPRNGGIQHHLSSLHLNGDEPDNVIMNATNYISNDLGLGLSDDDDDEVGSRVRSREASIDSVGIPRAVRNEIDSNPYDFRKNVNRAVASTWVDIDQSGTYDPEAERELARIKKMKMRAAAKKRNAAAVKPEKFIVVLQFPTRITTVLNLVDGEENWPDGWSEVDSEEERVREERRAARKSLAKKQPKRIRDPANIVDDLTGHPAARGCTECRKAGEDCSLVHGQTWPCQICKEQDIECNLIIPPVEKDKCRRCEDDDEPCSFTDPRAKNKNNRGVCDRCHYGGHLGCAIRPPKGYKIPRIDLAELSYGPNREYVNCSHCRASKRRCSVKSKKDRGPCNQCKKAKIGCTFFEFPPTPPIFLEDEPTKVRRKENRVERPPERVPLFTDEEIAEYDRQARAVRKREPTPEFEMEDTLGRKGRFTHLWTSFAHPIDFQIHSQSIQGQCDFCASPCFGILGHCEKRVYTIRWHNDMGYTEIGGGHRDQHDATVMCQRCTMGRVQMIICDHGMRSLGDAQNLDFEAAADDLAESEPGPDRSHQLQRWCSLCFTPASFRCGVQQPNLFDSFADTGEETIIDGCGFRLCTKCEGRLRCDFQGDYEALIATMDKDPKFRDEEEENEDATATVTRADVGLLLKQGILMRTVENSIGP